MENESFKIGDVVVLKSGSPKMTVVYSDPKMTQCIFFNEFTNELIYPKGFNTPALKLAN
ncbi:DUF2158 domain-containing protein [Flavobacterium branchiophilum]|uniref:Uncharacterized protein DUF2158 n=1 Tax=Flavobacterium branchiophilum TaxID=55197 RepID=A0A543G148_9FLAO|nr:DUF2158 domain-containing protein [Flavobacterium branchiophilum]TQM39813.1 uncharacterized protein DUF2158 [Flavobacterium branchiophilum]GEM55275.1 hypothetical protein FB1_14960 [Flavobacterium branchiophilum NBRC 15030 = ATCC 35035]